MPQDKLTRVRRPRSNVSAALGLIIGWADRETNRIRSTLAFANEKPYTQFQHSAWQGLFMCGAFSHFTGAKSATQEEIIGAFCDAEAVAFIAEHCVNAYWFWTLFRDTASEAMIRMGSDTNTDVLPFTKADFVAAQERIKQQQSEVFGKLAGGITRGDYSGTYTPEFLQNDLEKSDWLHNVRQHLEAGLASGHLLMAPYKPLWRAPRKLFPRKKAAAPLMSTIFNPLLRSDKKS
jgi:hypothetical protein